MKPQQKPTNIKTLETRESVLTGELRKKVDGIWDAFWSGGISNPLEVLEQITYLLFIRRLDDLQTNEENKANRTGKPIERRIFPEGQDQEKRLWDDLRWSRFKQKSPAEMFSIIGERVFPFLQELGEEGSTYEGHMKNARFTIPTAALLSKVVDMLDEIPMQDRDTKGDIYEYMLGKLATAGTNGQFRTPRHIIQLMVEMTIPTAKDIICDPASGSAGFLVQAAEYLRKVDPTLLTDPAREKEKNHFNRGLFHGFEFDSTMLRIGSMNMLLHGVEDPNISYRDSLSDEVSDCENRYTLILANPPFAGSLDYEATSQKLQRVVKTKQTELLFLALFLQLLKPGGRAAVIVPDGVLDGPTKAHKELRRKLVEDHLLEGVISLPSGVFKPYAGVSTAILLFTKTGKGGTENVWFYNLLADGWSLDGKRDIKLPIEKTGPNPKVSFLKEDHDKNNLPDCLKRWGNRKTSEKDRLRTEQSFCVSKEEIKKQSYDLSFNRYREFLYEEINHRPPFEILEEIKEIEVSISKELRLLEDMLND